MGTDPLRSGGSTLLTREDNIGDFDFTKKARKVEKRLSILFDCNNRGNRNCE